MAKKDYQGLVNRMHRHATGRLAAVPLMTIEAFEQMLFDAFHQEWEDDRATLDGSSRTRWQNLTDWVKAIMTRDEVSTYLTINGVDYIAYMVPIGIINSIDRIVGYRTAWALMRRIADETNPKAKAKRAAADKANAEAAAAKPTSTKGLAKTKA